MTMELEIFTFQWKNPFVLFMITEIIKKETGIIILCSIMERFSSFKKENSRLTSFIYEKVKRRSSRQNVVLFRK